MSRLPFILCALLLSGCYLSDEVTPDQDIWPYNQPEAVGLNRQVLLDLNEDLNREEYGFIKGLVIVKDDQMVFENYYGGSSRNELKSVGRASYSLAVLLLGDFISNESISSLDDPISNYLPEYEDIFTQSPLKREITIRHLLEYKSGFIWNEPIEGTFSRSSDLQQMRLTADWTKYILSKDIENTPGVRTVLNSSTGILLAQIYQNILGDESLTNYIERVVFNPLGITNYAIESLPEGGLNLANGLQLSTLDYAKLGYLVMQEGRWKNKVRVIERDWILDATSVYTPLSNFGYGYGWWIFSSSFISSFMPVTTDCIFISGGSGQDLYILPSINTVVAITAENHFGPRSQTIYNPSFYVFRDALRSSPISPTD